MVFFKPYKRKMGGRVSGEGWRGDGVWVLTSLSRRHEFSAVSSVRQAWKYWMKRTRGKGRLARRTDGYGGARRTWLFFSKHCQCFSNSVLQLSLIFLILLRLSSKGLHRS
jgi:hypothetical protein